LSRLYYSVRWSRSEGGVDDGARRGRVIHFPNAIPGCSIAWNAAHEQGGYAGGRVLGPRAAHWVVTRT
jgi:hypothetical protein